MRTLLLALGCSLAGAALAAALLIPHLPDRDPPLVRSVESFASWPAAKLDCQALRQQAWQAPALALHVEDRSYQEVSAFVSRTALEPDQALQLFGVYGGLPRIELSAGKQAQNLLLTSYDKTLWSIELAADANIRRIFVSETIAEVRLSQRADASWLAKFKRAVGLSQSLDSIQLIRLDSENSCGLYGYDWHEDSKAQMRALLAGVEQLTGLQVQSFQGNYSPQPNSLAFKGPLPSATQATRAIQPAPSVALQPERTSADSTPWIESVQEMREQVRLLIERGVLPERVGGMDMAAGGQLMQLQAIDLSQYPSIQPDANGNFACPGHEDSALEGDERANIAECGFGNTHFYGGAGKDLLDDAWGNDIIYGGTGDDSLDAGWGSDILLFGRGWGQDTLDKTCHNARFDAARTPGSDNLDYRWSYNNFIVFGPGIAPSDLHWEGKRLLHKDGDSLNFDKGNICFSFVFADDSTASLVAPNE